MAYNTYPILISKKNLLRDKTKLLKEATESEIKIQQCKTKRRLNERKSRTATPSSTTYHPLAYFKTSSPILPLTQLPSALSIISTALSICSFSLYCAKKLQTAHKHRPEFFRPFIFVRPHIFWKIFSFSVLYNQYTYLFLAMLLSYNQMYLETKYTPIPTYRSGQNFHYQCNYKKLQLLTLYFYFYPFYL